MINTKMKSIRGISLISLVITTIVLIILANVIIYNVRDNLRLGKLENMQNDIENLRDKISSYYTQNGKIPATLQYTNFSHIGVISQAVDTGDFLVIDLSALENLTLNYGKDFEKVKSLESLTPEDAKNYTDLYIINETSHNIFYVAGITVDNETYYTDYTSESIDSVSVDLRYVDGVKIPDGFYYVEGTKDTGIIIKSNDNNEYEYKWIVENDEIETIPENVAMNTNEEEDFIKSVNAYKGYYQNMHDSSVMYLGLNNWSPQYKVEGTYKDKNGDTAYIPMGFSVSETPRENTIHEGLVVKDSNDNEWVWIEVPKTIYTTATSSEDYENIEKDMQTYASTYMDSDYTDTWYNGCGIATQTEYNNLKNTMLKSVYEKGGFYIGRYEAGTVTARTANSDTLTRAVIQQSVYPYNYITCSDAQAASRDLVTGGKTSSLMFGIQWDLVLKFIETKGGKTQSELKTDSTQWGNYANSTFNITRGQYTTNPSITNSWITVDGNYQKNSALLTTAGMTNTNSTLNIYDLAGNVAEWTLEQNTADTNLPCSFRGGHYANTDNNNSCSYRTGYPNLDASDYIGFRPTFY